MQTHLKLIALLTLAAAGCPAIANEVNESQTFCGPSVLVQNNSSSTGKGMAVAQYFPLQASLGVMDTPLSYGVPVGPTVDFSISYDSARSPRPIGALTNLGQGWSFNWVSFVTPTSSKATVLNRGGITETFLPKNTQGRAKSYTTSQISHATLHEVGLNKFERRLPDGSKEVFDLPDETGRILLTKVVDSNGIACSIHYDNQLRISHITDALGQQSTLQYVSEQKDSLGFYKIRSITDPFGRKAIFSYDSNSLRLNSSTDTIGIVSEFNYEAGSYKMNSLKTPYGITSFKHYVPKGSPTHSAGLQIILPNGEKSIVEHWAGSIRESYVWDREAIRQFPADPENNVHTHCSTTSWNRDAKTGQELGIPMWTKTALESPVAYSYEGQSSNGFAGKVDLPTSIRRKVMYGAVLADQTVKFEYNAIGQLTKETDPLGRTITYTYAPNNIDLLEVRAKNNDLLGHWEYDKNHRQILFVDCSGNRVKYEYNKFGQLTKLIDASNNIWVWQYDQRGFLLKTYGPGKVAQLLSTFSYDKIGRLASETDSEGTKVSYSYDQADRITSITYGDGSTEQMTYDRLDLVAIKDRAGELTKKSYNKIGQLSSVENALGAKTSFTWCSCGSRMSVTDAAGHTTSWKYDLQGRVVAKVFPDGAATTFEYEKDGHRLISRKDALNQLTTYSYNLDDSLKKIAYSNTVNPTNNAEISYDQTYPMANSVKTGSDTIQFSYYPMIKNAQDAPLPGAGLLQSVNSSDKQASVSYQYDSLGRRTKRTVGNTAVSWTYDNFGRLQSEINALGHFKFNYANDTVAGALSSVSYPNGVNCRYSYDKSPASQNLTLISATTKNSQPLSEFHYKYSSVSGQLVHLKEFIEGKNSADIALNYDAIGQLLEYKILSSQKSWPGFHRYAYDQTTNRISAQSDSQKISATYNNLNQLTTVQSLDAKESSASTKITYDANGNLLDDGVRKYKWDAENRLISIEYQKEEASTYFVYNAMGQRAEIQEVKSGKIISKKKLTWDLFQPCKETDSANNNSKELFSLGELNGAKKFYFVLDHLGSTRTVTDQEGKVVSRLDYEPFGSAKLLQGNYEPSKQYAGYYAHPESKLFLTLCRAYDSKTARWLSRDPLGEDAGLDLYTYAANNPISLYDPLGLDWKACTGSGGKSNTQTPNQNTWNSNNSLLNYHPNNNNNQRTMQSNPGQQNTGGLNMPNMVNPQGYRYSGMLPPGVNAPGIVNNAGQGPSFGNSYGTYSVGGTTFYNPANGYVGQNKTSPLVPLGNGVGQATQTFTNGYGNMQNNNGKTGNGIQNTNSPQGQFGRW